MDSIFTHPANYQNGRLHFGQPAQDLTSFVQGYDGPMYIYDLQHFKLRLETFLAAVPKGSWVAYALKANTYPGFLKKVNELGAGVDVVSGGEFSWALKHGVPASKVVFSGVAKSDAEIRLAIENEVGLLNVESLSELKAIARLAQEMKKSIRIGLRLNPDLDVQTHPYISTGLKENKFGIPLDEFRKYLEFIRTQPLLKLKSLSHHLGSQMMSVDPIKESLKLFKNLFEETKRDFADLTYLDIGGGLGIDYENQTLTNEKVNFQNYIEALKIFNGSGIHLIFEPGRFLVGHAGLLLAQVRFIKETKDRNFLILDTGSHHLVRPMLYSAYHHILPLKQNNSLQKLYDVVGPLCESSDFLAKSRPLPEMNEGDFVAILDSGAYGMVMANDYNLRAKPKEIGL